MDNWSINTLELGKTLFIPSNVLIVTLAIGVMLLWFRVQRAGLWVTTITATLLFGLAILPIASWLAKPLETRFPPIRQLPDSVTGIILLGGPFKTKLTSDWSQPQVNDHAGRLIAFVTLARKYPTLQLVFSGDVAESDIARDLFGSLGMNTQRIVFESRSRNTCENAMYTAQLIKPLPQQTWVLVTSAMDMPRAVGAFKKAGFRVLPYPVDYTTSRSVGLDLLPAVVGNLNELDHAAHEWLGLLSYRFLGCNDTLFPGL